MKIAEGLEIKSIEQEAELYAENWEEIHPELEWNNMYPSDISKIDFLAGAKAMAKMMYNNEEVKEIAFNFYYDMSRQMNVPENLVSENRTNMDIWFEENKRKQ